MHRLEDLEDWLTPFVSVYLFEGNMPLKIPSLHSCSNEDYSALSFCKLNVCFFIQGGHPQLTSGHGTEISDLNSARVPAGGGRVGDGPPTSGTQQPVPHQPQLQREHQPQHQPDHTPHLGIRHRRL